MSEKEKEMPFMFNTIMEKKNTKRTLKGKGGEMYQKQNVWKRFIAAKIMGEKLDTLPQFRVILKCLFSII